MKAFLRTLAHAAVSGALVAGASAAQVGQVTVKNVVFPALTAAVLAALHAMAPSTLGD